MKALLHLPAKHTVFFQKWLPLFLAVLLSLATAVPMAAQAVSRPETSASGTNAGAGITVRTTGTRAGEEDVVLLSPFVVVAESGYTASNSMSGTRLNSKIEDLAASISVVTKDMMNDFAMIDINDFFLYEANTEGMANYTDFAVSRFGDIVDNASQNPGGANRIRGMGAANMARGGVAQTGIVPLDRINIDAVEISRGPNSSLFGLGNTAGTVNVVPARANVDTPKSVIELRGDDRGGWRASIDLNRPLIPKKLAFRVSGVKQMDEFLQKPSFNRTERFNGMVTFQPYKLTTVRANFERYYNLARRPNMLLPRDGITYWKESGMPTWDPVTYSVNRNGVYTQVPFNANAAEESILLGPGLESGDSFLYQRPSLYVERNGDINLWMVNRLSTADNPSTIGSASQIRYVQSGRPPVVGPLAQSTLSITDKSIYDWESINIAAPNWFENKANNFSVELEQFFINTRRHLLGLQAGWYREDISRYNRAFIGTGLDGRFSQIIYIDINERLLDGTPNPYFLRPYLAATEPTVRKQPILNDTYRAQLAYMLRLSSERSWVRWFGDHTIVGYAEYRARDTRNYLYRDAIISDHTWLPAGTNRANGPAAARGYYRYYVGDNQGFNVDYAPVAWKNSWGTRDFLWWNNTAGQWVTEPTTIGEALLNTNGISRVGSLIRTRGFVLQSHLWEGRIVTTIGLRRDSSNDRNARTPNVGPDGITYDPGSDSLWGEWIRRDGNTTTRGIVLKPFRGWEAIERAAGKRDAKGALARFATTLNFHYNSSNSFKPEPLRQNLFCELLPDPTGRGKDYGFSFTLPEGKLVMRYNIYDTREYKARNGDSGTIAARLIRLDYAYAGSDDQGNLNRKLTQWVTAANPEWSSDQVAAEVAHSMGVEPRVIDRLNLFPIGETDDMRAKGHELEISWNPKNFLTFRFTAAQQKSIYTNMSPTIQAYIDMRMPVWLSIIDPTTGYPWFITANGTAEFAGGYTSPEDFLNELVVAPTKLAKANEGRPRSQVREWRFNAMGKISMFALTTSKYLRPLSFTGALRWESKGSIGFHTYDNDPNTYDPDRPIFDKAHTYVDLGIAYNVRLPRNLGRLLVQLNARNAFESGRLQPVGALPDGTPYAYRIVEPRIFILTTTWTF